MATLVDSTYFYDSNTKRQAHAGIDLFNNYIRSLDDVRNAGSGSGASASPPTRSRSAQKAPISPFAAANHADLLLHYLTFLRADTTDHFWRPQFGSLAYRLMLPIMKVFLFWSDSSLVDIFSASRWCSALTRRKS